MIDSAVFSMTFAPIPETALTGQYSIRINDQWRICIVWIDAGDEQIEIVDYH